MNWKKDEYDLHATIGVHINDTNLVLNSYRPDDQIGSYVCIVTYRTLSIRSIPCRVYTAGEVYIFCIYLRGTKFVKTYIQNQKRSGDKI